MPVRKRVALVGCGGTISSIARSSLDVLDYPETGRKLGIEEVLARTPELERFAACVPIPFRAVGSSAVGPQEWRAVAPSLGRTPQPAPQGDGLRLPPRA